MYKLLNDTVTGEPMDVIILLSSNTFIPFDPANTSYQEYLAWLDEGNTPEPADPVE